MKIIGLTGGIGSGKTMIAELFRINGIPVYESDARSKALCQSDKKLMDGLKELFGDDVFNPDGCLNRPFMAKAIFSNKALLQAANNLIHPVVIQDFKRWVTCQDASIVVQETAILFEANLENSVDWVVCVTAPEEVRIQRTCVRSGLSPEEVHARMRNQLSDGELIRRSDFIICNDGLTPLIPQVDALLKTLAEKGM